MSDIDTAWSIMCNAVQHGDVSLIRELAMKKVPFPMVRPGAGALFDDAHMEDDKPNHARHISSATSLPGVELQAMVRQLAFNIFGFACYTQSESG